MPSRSFFPVWVASGGQVVIRRGPDCPTPGEAAAILKEKLAKGYASWGLVVEVRDGRREAMEAYIFPTGQRRTIRRWLDVMDMIEDGKL